MQTYQIPSEIWGPFCLKCGGPKNMKFSCDFGQLRDLIANISVTQQDIVNRKTAFQKLNLMYFGPQMAKNRTRVLTHPPAIVQRTGVNKSVAFARWQHRWPSRWALALHFQSYSRLDCVHTDMSPSPSFSVRVVSYSYELHLYEWSIHSHLYKHKTRNSVVTNVRWNFLTNLTYLTAEQWNAVCWLLAVSVIYINLWYCKDISHL